MASKSAYYQCHDPANGAQPGGENRCRITVPNAHTLVWARIRFQHMVATGTLTVTLRSSDPGDARAGRAAATSLDNDDLNPGTITLANIHNVFEFVLTDDAKAAASPANRNYWVTLTGTNAADRLDWPTLELMTTESS